LPHVDNHLKGTSRSRSVDCSSDILIRKRPNFQVGVPYETIRWNRSAAFEIHFQPERRRSRERPARKSVLATPARDEILRVHSGIWDNPRPPFMLFDRPQAGFLKGSEDIMRENIMRFCNRPEFRRNRACDNLFQDTVSPGHHREKYYPLPIYRRFCIRSGCLECQ
jgi:hypothetical protein